jgi:hypothetical protein
MKERFLTVTKITSPAFAWGGQDGLILPPILFFSFIFFPWHFSDKNQSNQSICTHPSLNLFGCVLQPLCGFFLSPSIAALSILQAIDVLE